MAKKVLDFDRFLAEKVKDTIEVVVYGRKLEIRNEIPAIVPIMMARANEEGGNANLSVFKAADIMFGKENVNALCEAGMTASEFTELLQSVFQMINGKSDDDDEDEGVLDGDSGEAKKDPNP